MKNTSASLEIQMSLQPPPSRKLFRHLKDMIVSLETMLTEQKSQISDLEEKLEAFDRLVSHVSRHSPDVADIPNLRDRVNALEATNGTYAGGLSTQKDTESIKESLCVSDEI